MKGYISLLKGGTFKERKNKNSLFFFNNQRNISLNEDNQVYLKTTSNLNERSNTPKNPITFNSFLCKNDKKRKSTHRFLFLNTENINVQHLKDPTKNPEIYEEIFLKLLQETDDIPNISNSDKKNKFNYKYGFYFLYMIFSSSPKIQWKDFEISESIFHILYNISLKVKKAIKTYSIIYNKNLNEVINSYDKKYTQKLHMRNWNIKPSDAYKNFHKTKIKLEIETKTEANKAIENMPRTDFIVKTNNHGKGKTLIFFGKCLNLYIDDHRNNNNKYNGISMATEESEFNKNTNFEIVYDSEEAAIKKCNKNIFKKLNRNNRNSFKTTHSRGFQSTFNSQNKNNLNGFGGSTDKFCATTNLFLNYKKLIFNVNDKNNKDIRSHKNINSSNNVSNKSNSRLFPKIRNKSRGNIISFSNGQNIKKYKKLLESFSALEEGNKTENKQKIIKNFLTKEDYDFYY